MHLMLLEPFFSFSSDFYNIVSASHENHQLVHFCWRQTSKKRNEGEGHQLSTSSWYLILIMNVYVWCKWHWWLALYISTQPLCNGQAVSQGQFLSWVQIYIYKLVDHSRRQLESSLFTSYYTYSWSIPYNAEY